MDKNLETIGDGYSQTQLPAYFVTSVARSWKAFTARFIKNHGRLGTFHGRKIFCHGHIHGFNSGQIYSFCAKKKIKHMQPHNDHVYCKAEAGLKMGEFYNFLKF